MLTSIRARATGWIAWAIVIFISIPFALWGVNSYFEGGASIHVAVVDGEEIDQQAYERALYIERDNLRQQMGSNVDHDYLSSSVVGRQVIDSMVSDMLQFQYARDNGYTVDDETLAKAIRRFPDFMTNEQFDPNRYERILQFSGYSVSEFEESQRQAATVFQIQNSFVLSSFNVDKVTDDALALLIQERNGDYVLITPELYASEIEVSEEQIQERYESNKNQYTDPEKVKVEYIQLSVSDFATDYVPSEQIIQELYDSQMNEFLREETRSVSHILIKPEGDSEEDETKAKELADDVASRAKAGEDFAELVTTYSEDTGSVQQGGSIGEINRGATVPEFERVAFSLEKGVISDPVRSSFGYHIIRVDEIRAEEIQPLEEVKEDLVAQAVKVQAESELGGILEEVRNVAYEQPDSLEPIADLFNQEIKTSDWFTREFGNDVASNEIVRTVAFSDLVLEEGFNSELLELDVENYVVLRKADYEAAVQLAVDDVRDEISESLLREMSIEQARSVGEETIENLKRGDDWDEFVAENGLTVESLPPIVGDPDNPDSYSIANFVYSAPLPSADEVIFGGDALFDGRYVVYRIVGVTEGDIATAEEEQRSQIENQLKNRFGFELYQNYVTNLKDSANIKIYEEFL